MRDGLVGLWWIDDELRAEVVATLLLGRRERRRNGAVVSRRLDAFTETLKDPSGHASGQERTFLDAAEEITDAEFVTITETARRLQLSERTIRRLIACGELDAVRVGHRVRVPLAAVREFKGRRVG
jgi:excisionase family DNA binding protein